MDNRPIGIMDSGIGGLTVARVLHETYPEEGIVFLGDTKRNPYGERSRDDIVRFSFAIKDFLKEHQVKMILIACNTISFNVPPAFFEEDIPVIKAKSMVYTEGTPLENLPKDVVTMHEKAQAAAETLEQLKQEQKTEPPKQEEKKEEVSDDKPEQ